uniref:hypothetical protein n=1 Tax=Pedobacter schmidteae TaxID=2201271 RepID=UPI000EB4992A|nr:hypothetical protein [Pedobacter schmidteae]
MKDKDYYKQRKQICLSNLMYSVQRMDLLIISISGAGVYVVLEVLKFGYGKELKSPFVLKIAGILFILAIIINLLSQLTGKRANHHDVIFCDAHIDADDPPTDDQKDKIEHHDSKSEFYSTLTHRLDKTSVVVLSLGLFLVILYFLINF